MPVRQRVVCGVREAGRTVTAGDVPARVLVCGARGGEGVRPGRGRPGEAAGGAGKAGAAGGKGVRADSNEDSGCALPGGRAVVRVMARQAPGRRGNLRGRARRPRVGRFPASACSLGLRRTARCWPGSRGLRPGTVRRTGRPFIRVRQPAAIPRRQLICRLICIPADSGIPWRR